MISPGPLPGATGTYAKSVSTDGSVVVGTAIAGVNSQAFRWTATTGMVQLGLPAGAYAAGAEGVSADGGVIVGGFLLPSGDQRPFRWTQEGGMIDLETMFAAAIPPGWDLTAATGVSADGNTVIGLAVANGQFRGWVAVVPGPGSAAVLALAGVAAARRRRCAPGYASTARA